MQSIDNIITNGKSILEKAICESSNVSFEKKSFTDIQTCLSNMDDKTKFSDSTLKKFLQAVNQLLNNDVAKITNPQHVRKVCSVIDDQVLKPLQEKLGSLTTLENQGLKEKGIKVELLKTSINSLLKKVTSYVEDLDNRMNNQQSAICSFDL